VQFVDGACPVVPRTILTYSQSADSTSPWYSDQTRMFSRKEWNAPPFCEADVLREALSTTQLSSRRAIVDTGGCTGSSDLGGARARIRGRAIELSVPAGTTAEVVRGGKRIARIGGPAVRRVSAKRSGTYLIRFRAGSELKRTAFRRTHGRLRSLPSFERRDPCGLIRAASLVSPTIGRSVTLNVGLAKPASLSVRVIRAARTVTRYRSSKAGKRYRVKISGKRLRKGGLYAFEIVATAGRERARLVLNAVRP
jgi:hypothetical protein